MADRVLTSETDGKARTRAKQQDKRRAERERVDLENVLKHESGRRFLWDLLVEAGVFRLSFVAGDQWSTVFNEGRRAMGNALFARIQSLNPEYYHVMAKEAAHLEETDKSGTQPEQKPADEPEEIDDGN